MSFLAPAGTPISAGLFLNSLIRGATSGQTCAATLASRLAEHAGHEQAWLAVTGRAAMTLALRAMRDACDDPQRVEVIVPAYTCYSVPASALKAGLRPRLCDVDPATLSLRPEALERFDFSRVLAIVTANLYGLPNELTAVESLARRHGVWMLDDAAQALGARLDGRAVGSFGDAGLYSFDKGKNITSLEGGALVASNPQLRKVMQQLYQDAPASPGKDTLMRVAKLAAYSTLLRPGLYDMVRRLPGLGLGRTLYDETYPLQRYSPLLAGFALNLYGRLESLTRDRRTKADALMDGLQQLPGVQLITPLPQAQPAYARLPFLVRDAARRVEVITALETQGIGATASYPEALNNVPEIRRALPPEDLGMPGAEQVASRIVTLPTHAYCPADLPARVHALLKPLLGQ